MQNYSYALYPDELYHYGKLGMHWGVRNYQNKDGSLTALGRIHYGVEGFYNGPKMEHLKSQMARGWATANDPELLGRKMSQVQERVERAAQLTKRRDFWNHDLNTVIPYIKRWMNPEQYNVMDTTGATASDYKNSDSAKAVSVDWSGAKVGGYANKVLNTDVPGRAYVDPDNLELGNMLINVYQGYQDAKNVKMSDLAEFSINRKIIKGTESTDEKLGITTAQEAVTVNQPYSTMVGTISVDPTLITGGGQKFKTHTVVTNVSDALEREYGSQIRKRADNIRKNTATVSDEQAAANKQAFQNVAFLMGSGKLSPQQAISILQKLPTTTMSDVEDQIKNMKKSVLQDYESWLSKQTATVKEIQYRSNKFDEELDLLEKAWYSD